MATPTFILPSAPTYTEGFVNGLNVYPNPTNFVANQVPFTRATTATRTNAAGLIELVPYNLFQYSEQFDNATWNKTNASITANTTISPSGIQNADTMTDNATVGIHGIDYAGAVGVYTCSVYAKKSTSNYIGVYSSSALQGVIFNLNTGTFSANIIAAPTSYSITSVGNGWYRCTITTTTTSTAVFRILMSNDGSGFNYSGTGQTVFIWGAQLVEGTDALPYQLTETRLNRPRVDFSLGGCPNLLLEPQRTNLATWSEDFTNAVWTGGAIVTANAFIAPNGTLTADTLTDNSTTQFAAKQQNFTITPNAVYTASFFVRKTTGAITSYPGLTVFFTGTLPRIIRLILNTTTGTFNYEVSGVAAVNSYSATMTSFNNDYWKVTIRTQDNQSNTTYQFILSAAISTDGTTLSATATGSATFWGAQLELGAYPTSYIPTSSASVTRNTDTFALSNVFTNDLISSAGGTWFVELRNNIVRTRDGFNGNDFFLSTTTAGFSGNNFLIANWVALTRLQIIKCVNGSSVVLYTTTANTAKIAIKWNGTTADIFENGIKVVSATAFTATNMQNLQANTFDVPKNINSMALYNTPISDAECIAITTL